MFILVSLAAHLPSKYQLSTINNFFLVKGMIDL